MRKRIFRDNGFKGWLYLLPAILFLGVFLVYPLIDVWIYSFEEGYNSAAQTYYGIGPYNYSYVLHDPYFLQAVKNTFVLVVITVPLSTGIALLISLGLNSIGTLKGLFQTIYFLPYVTNTLAIGLVFMILFKKTAYSDGMINLLIHWFGGNSVDFKGKNIVFVVFLSLMMIPNELVIITNFVTITNLDLRNTFSGLILPSVTSVFYIYLLKENFEQIPDSLYYAAKVDGTSDLKYLWKVMLPISKPTLVTVTILKVIECWNSYVWPRLITDDEAYYLVSNGIQEIRENGFGRENIPAMMAAVTVISLPLILLFLLFRRKIMEGVVRGGTKG